ncbi:MAG: hypothetical protein IPL65_18590 [Lewinellaceae bacterium]|nr:hypothetical protein [Lewinellaceae bacterium]
MAPLYSQGSSFWCWHCILLGRRRPFFSRTLPFIRKNAQTALGTEGIIGNKVVKITPRKSPAPFVQDGDTLYPKKVLSTAEMLETLSTTNNNVAFLSEELLQTVRRINDSPLLNGLLNDPSLAANLRASLLQLRGASTDAATTMTELQSMVHATQQERGYPRCFTPRYSHGGRFGRGI